MRRYKLERSANGMITQCENADGGNIFAQREELNKKALKNLKRPTPGKLGNLSNLQLFNFRIATFETGEGSFVFKDYNTTNIFPTPLTNAVYFGANNDTGQIVGTAQYYNIVYVNAKLVDGFAVTTNDNLQPPSYISFYLAQNTGDSLNSLSKIPQPAPLSTVGGGSTAITVDGAIQGNQSFTVDVRQETGVYAQNNNLQGFRASGLALSQIRLNFSTNVTRQNLILDVEVGVDVSSASTTY